MTLAASYLACRMIVESRAGRVMRAIRDAESRTRFLGYPVESFKLWVFVFSAVLAGIAGALYVPQIGIINPSEFAPDQLDRSRDLGGGGRTRHALRRGRGRGAGELCENVLYQLDSGSLVLRAGRAVRAGDVVSAARNYRPRWRRKVKTRKGTPAKQESDEAAADRPLGRGD